MTIFANPKQGPYLSMQKKFVSNLIFLLLLNLIIKPFWILGIDRMVQRELGTEEYGLYFALLNFSFLLNIVLDVGLTNYNNRNISRYQFLVKKHFSALFTLKLILGLVYIAVAGTFAILLGYHKDNWELLFWLLINQFFVYLVLYLRSNLAGLQLFKYDSIVSVLDRFLMIIFCGILIATNDEYHLLTIRSFVLTQTLAYAIVAAVVIAIIFRKVGRVRFVFRYHFSRIIIRKSLPYAILVLLMTFYNRADSVMLERMLPGTSGAIESGIYAHGYRLLDSANMIAFLFSTLLLPMFSSMLKRNEAVQGLMETSFNMLLSGAMLAGVICFSFSLDIISMLYTEKVNESAVVFQWLILSLIPISITYIFGTLLTANGNLKWLNRMAIAGVSLNIGLNLILIPRHQALGAAISSLITQGVTAIAQMILARKFVKVDIGWRMVSRTLFYGILLFLSAFVIQSTIPHLGIALKVAIMCAIGGALALLLGMLKISALFALLQNKAGS